MGPSVADVFVVTYIKAAAITPALPVLTAAVSRCAFEGDLLLDGLPNRAVGGPCTRDLPRASFQLYIDEPQGPLPLTAPLRVAPEPSGSPRRDGGG